MNQFDLRRQFSRRSKKISGGPRRIQKAYKILSGAGGIEQNPKQDKIGLKKKKRLKKILCRLN